MVDLPDVLIARRGTPLALTTFRCCPHHLMREQPRMWPFDLVAEQGERFEGAWFMSSLRAEIRELYRAASRPANRGVSDLDERFRS